MYAYREGQRAVEVGIGSNGKAVSGVIGARIYLQRKVVGVALCSHLRRDLSLEALLEFELSQQQLLVQGDLIMFIVEGGVPVHVEQALQNRQKSVDPAPGNIENAGQRRAG